MQLGGHRLTHRNVGNRTITSGCLKRFSCRAQTSRCNVYTSKTTLGAGQGFTRIALATTTPPRPVARATATPVAMVNVDVSPSVILGVGLIGAGVFLWQVRQSKPWISKDYDVVISCISLLVGGILIFQGWRLDPLLLFGQLMTTGAAVSFGIEALRLRSEVYEQEEKAELRDAFRRKGPGGGGNGAALPLPPGEGDPSTSAWGSRRPWDTASQQNQYPPVNDDGYYEYEYDYENQAVPSGQYDGYYGDDTTSSQGGGVGGGGGYYDYNDGGGYTEAEYYESASAQQQGDGQYGNDEYSTSASGGGMRPEEVNFPEWDTQQQQQGDDVRYDDDVDQPPRGGGGRQRPNGPPSNQGW